MNIFLIGNGFDLHHKFPTKYFDFLHTVNFLIENSNQEFKTVGDVLKNPKLHERDKNIGDCYAQHKKIYDITGLPKEVIDNIIKNAKENKWFVYLYNCVAVDATWIDFEKEIARVLEAFEELFNCEDKFSLSDGGVIYNASEYPEYTEDRFIVSQFDFFLEKQPRYSGGYALRKVKPEFVIEKIKGSDTFYLAKEEIAEELYISLRKLADLLREYLLYFVDKPSEKYVEIGIKPHFKDVPTANRVYSFNYTNTMEVLYDNYMVDHIHGNTNEDIVLGINPDDKDELTTIDTIFLQFKKYFQRVFYKTDFDYLRYISFTKGAEEGNTLYVMGHSLDITDEDLIKQIFESVGNIIILYHDDKAIKERISNLVKLYGKKEFDKLREKKNLQFVLQEEIEW